MSKKQRNKQVTKVETNEWSEKIAPFLFDWNLMENRCTTSIESINEMVRSLPNGKLFRSKTDHAHTYAFVDKGAPILGVAHLDATGALPHFGRVQIRDDWWVLSRWLDDRLGLFLLLDVLPRFFNYDILLTTGEESGHSSAAMFEPPKDRTYQWMFELDRMRDDVVYYQYFSNPLEKALKAAGFGHLEHGSYTDIVDLHHLGCAGFNVGIGYEENHGDWSRANLSVTLAQMGRFAKFFTDNLGVTYPHDPKKGRYTSYPAASTSGYNTPPAVVGKFTWHQLVKHVPTGNLLMVQGQVWNDQGTHKVWCTRKAENNAIIGMNYLEDELTEDLTKAEENIAKDIWPQGKLLGPIPDGEPAVSRPTAVDDDWAALYKTNEGPYQDPAVKTARLRLEKLIFGSAIVHSTYDDRKVPGFEVAYTGKYTYGQAVVVKGVRYDHYGQIDCDYPLLTNTGSHYWWVRYDEVDAADLTLELVHVDSISLPEEEGNHVSA